MARSDGALSLLGNILWIVLGGLPVFVQYVVSGVGLCCTVIGIPWGFQCFKLALLALLPFGREIVPSGELARGPLGMIMNIIWLIIGGVWIFLTHLLFALVCAVTVVGIPFALQHWKLAKLSLMPFGRDVR